MPLNPLPAWLLVAMTLALASGERSFGAEFHVSPLGNDANPGTRTRPLRTLEAARDAVRRAGPENGATVWLHAGRHLRSATFSLEQRDSGTPGKPVVFRALPDAEVIFDGGRIIPPSACVPVREADIVERLLPEARGKVVQIDLTALGITNFGAFGPRGYGRALFPTPPELFIDGQPLRVAQWPNPGEEWIPLGEVLDKGSVPRVGDPTSRPGIFRTGTPRAAQWTKAADLYLTGFFAWGYAEDTVKIARLDTAAGTFTTGQPHLYGYGGGRQKSLWKWCAVNLLEEIDLPGECFLDRETGRFYFLPPGKLAGAQIQISLLDAPFVTMTEASHVRFVNLIFENGRSDGIQMTGALSNVVAGCTLRNLGGRAISIRGTGNLVLSCDIYDLGAGGVSLNGGERRALIPAGNVVRNCDIHHLNRWYRNYHPCVSLGGVGNLAKHNHLHHCPGQAVLLSGNDHVIEFNELDHVIGEMSDQGAIYMGRNPSDAGNLYQFNFIHHTDTTHVGSYGNSGIFIDDGASGQRVFGNVFFQTGGNGAIKYHGGQFNEFINNVVVDCAMTVKYQLWNEERWTNFLHEASIQQKLLKDVNILQPPYSTRYPKLARIFEAPYTKESHVEERNYVTTAADHVFLDGAKLDFRIRDLPAVQAKVPGFEPVPFEKMGLHADAYRRGAIVPVAGKAFK